MCLGVLLRASHRSNCYFHTRISAALASLDIVEDPLGVLLVLVLLDVLFRAFNRVSSLLALARDSRELRSFCHDELGKKLTAAASHENFSRTFLNGYVFCTNFKLANSV